MPPEPPPAFAIRTTTPATTARPTTIPTQTFQLQPLRRCMPLELSMLDLLRSSSAASVSLPMSQRSDARATSGREGDEDHRVRGEPRRKRRRISFLRDFSSAMFDAPPQERLEFLGG